MTYRIIGIALVPFFLAACGGSNPPPTAPPVPEAPEAGVAAPAAPTDDGGADAAAAAAPAAENTAPAAPAALDKPASTSTIAGTSVSSVDQDALSDALKKMKWTADVSASTAGQYQDIKIDVTKGKTKGVIEIVRPAASPTASDSPVKAPSDQKADFEKNKAAVYYDDAADVLVAVTVDGKPYMAKQILSSLVKKGKAAGAQAAKKAGGKKGKG